MTGTGGFYNILLAMSLSTFLTSCFNHTAAGLTLQLGICCKADSCSRQPLIQVLNQIVLVVHDSIVRLLCACICQSSATISIYFLFFFVNFHLDL